MTTNPKPLLMRKQVDAFVNKHCDCTDPRCKFEEAACRTIEQMAELLEHASTCPRSLKCGKCYEAFLFIKSFNATGGEE